MSCNFPYNFFIVKNLVTLLTSITFSPFCRMENSLFRNLLRKTYIDKNQFDEYLEFLLCRYSFRSLLLLFPRNEVSCMLYEDFPLSINACIVDASADNQGFDQGAGAAPDYTVQHDRNFSTLSLIYSKITKATRFLSGSMNSADLK